MVRAAFHSLSRPRGRAYVAAWMGVLCMAFLLGLGGFGGLSLPAVGTETLGIGGPLVICSGTGFTVIDPTDGEGKGAIQDPGLCLMCLPIMGNASFSAVLALIVFMVWGLVPVRLGLAPVPAVERPQLQAFLTVRAARAPPVLV
ncbi:MAG: hypothetical protein K9H25_09270 [Rhodospirillum sp.]|nr:hypothetical protein [Rhodospirillum sp.]MCF8490685.1 hypothetical protein [Rhodospirillum sp.]MCF8502336.1 hypothetical protein [Rhodospirillum sp.]